MDPGMRAQAEELLRSGKMSPEDAAVMRAALQEGQPAGVDPNEARAQRLDAAQREFDQETSPGSMAMHVAGTAWDKLKGLGRGAAKLGDMALHPGTSTVQLAAVPEMRRQFGRGLSDSMFGLPAKLGDKLGITHYGETEEHDAAQPETQDVRTAGAIMGTAVPGGPMQQLGRGSLALASRFGLSPAMTALAASQMASGTNAAIQSGGDPRAVLEAAGDPLNLLAPAGVKVAQKAGQLGRAVTRAMRDDTSALGGGADTLKTLDEMRGRGALSGNVIRKVNDPELAALPRGKKGYVKAAENTAETIGKNTGEGLEKARATYAKDLNDILAEHGDAPYSMEGPQARLNKLRTENTVNGEAVDESLSAALDKAERMITKKTPSLGPGDTNASNARESTVADMLKVKKAMDTRAEWGRPATPESRPYRLIAREFAQQAESIDTRVKAMNSKFQSAVEPLEETNDILYNQDAKEVADRPALRRRAVGKLMRVGDDTTAGELGERDIQRLGELDPRNEKPIRTLREKKAIERTRFGMPNMSKSPEKWMTSGLEQNLDATRARIVDPMARALAAMGLDPVTRALIRARLAAQQQE